MRMFGKFVDNLIFSNVNFKLSFARCFVASFLTLKLWYSFSQIILFNLNISFVCKLRLSFFCCEVFHNLRICLVKLVAEFFAVGYFAVKKKLVSVRLGQVFIFDGELSHGEKSYSQSDYIKVIFL